MCLLVLMLASNKHTSDVITLTFWNFLNDSPNLQCLVGLLPTQSVVLLISYLVTGGLNLPLSFVWSCLSPVPNDQAIFDCVEGKAIIGESVSSFFGLKRLSFGNVKGCTLNVLHKSSESTYD